MTNGVASEHAEDGSLSGPSPSATIVIIGGGFSGTVTAVHLIGRLGAGGRVLIINRSGAMARGVAYGTTSRQHVLNVPAGRMSALEHDPDSFVRFLRQHGVAAEGGSFVGRHLYGAYLEALLADIVARTPGVTLERMVAEVVTIEEARDSTSASVELRDGTRIRADRVVLAVGNYPPLDPAVDDRAFFHRSPRYVRDPWQPDAFAAIDPRRPVLLIGTGLTMIDIALQLQALGVSGGITTLSRRGLLPQPHRSPSPVPDRQPRVPPLLEGAPTIRAYVRGVRQLALEAAQHGGDWRDVVGSLRSVTAVLWQRLSVEERRRFLRHVRPFWEVHRHRVAADPHQAFTRLRERGQVTVLAGRLVRVHEQADRVSVRWTPRGSCETRAIEVGCVVNCSGPAGDTGRLADPLFRTLRARGVIVPDALGLGIETSPAGALIGRDGRTSVTLFYVGPFLRARDWEATAVPELREYARQLAEHLIESLAAMRRVTRARSSVGSCLGAPTAAD